VLGFSHPTPNASMRPISERGKPLLAATRGDAISHNKYTHKTLIRKQTRNNILIEGAIQLVRESKMEKVKTIARNNNHIPKDIILSAVLLLGAPDPF
jgi:hypothetical protein